MGFNLQEKFGHLSQEVQIKEVSNAIARNPLVKVFDITGEDTAVNWRQHHAKARSIVAENPKLVLFAVIQKSRKGYWLTEWTALGYQEVPDAQRRRAAHGSDFLRTAEDFLALPSYHSSHYFKPEEGWLPRWVRD